MFRPAHFFLGLLSALATVLSAAAVETSEATSLAREFRDPPPTARPGVYWYFLDGNRDAKAMTADLEAMAQAGIGSVIFLEVDLGVPRGPVTFLNDVWQTMFVQAVRDTERLGLDFIFGVGPGWAGSGGPWVRPEDSMQHLVGSRTVIRGPVHFSGQLIKPVPRKPFFTLPADLESVRSEYYRDVAVLAFPTPAGGAYVDEISGLDEKALYYRAPYSSMSGVKPYLPAPGPDVFSLAGAAFSRERVVDLTARLQTDGSLDWEVPEGEWTIVRLGARNSGANTRPAPAAGYGLESDKFSTAALESHLDHYVRPLLAKTGPHAAGKGGWTMMHMDSWEMGAQNWTPRFREEFTRRRGYDPLPFLPVCLGEVAENKEVSERFLWDWRQTAQELVLDNHAGRLKEFAHESGMTFSIEPYDMNPTADLTLGGIADLPMGEFWANSCNTAYSCIEAASIAHTNGRAVVGAESLTSVDSYQLYPATIKNHLDWAFGAGINRIVFHTFPHQPLGPEALPGISFGPYGTCWHRNQTWWPMVDAVHRYIARSSHLLRQGVTVADVLYLTPEGAPQVFVPPASALTGGEASLPDRRGYNFDGCSPDTLRAYASVRDGCVVFPGGSAYRLLVLPSIESMTPELLAKIKSLVEQGATVIGAPPVRSPSLADFPSCDRKVREMAAALWGESPAPSERKMRVFGRGRVFWGGDLRMAPALPPEELFPAYNVTARLLEELGVPEDFAAQAPLRYTHRRTEQQDIYFVSNRSADSVRADCFFRVVAPGIPELWEPQTGAVRPLPAFTRAGLSTCVPLKFAPHESYFVVFPRVAGSTPVAMRSTNFPEWQVVGTLEGAWHVQFQTGRGTEEKMTFDRLEDWTGRPEEEIRHYSGIATYRKTFDLPGAPAQSRSGSWQLNLGTVHDICRVRLNGHDLGVVWTAPWRVDITQAVQARDNRLEIEVANRWPNRLIGDAQPENSGVRTLSWKSGLLGGKEHPAGRYTFAYPATPYTASSPLLPSGLLGPVTLQREQ